MKTKKIKDKNLGKPKASSTLRTKRDTSAVTPHRQPTVSESDYNPCSSSNPETSDEGLEECPIGRNRRKLSEKIYGMESTEAPPKKRYRRYIKPINSGKRIKLSIAKNAGECYVTSGGKIARARQRRKLGSCRMKCRERIPDEICETLSKGFWDLKDVNLKRLYISPLISVGSKKRVIYSECSPSKRRNRNISLKYSVSVQGETVAICKGCFQNIFDLSNTFISTVVTKKLDSLSGVPAVDLRGRHSSTRNLPEATMDTIRDHILSFPAYESHYSRSKTSKKFLPPHLTRTHMLKLFTDKYPGIHISRFTYERKIKALGLSFKEPKTDTCKTCDTFQMQLKSSTSELQRTYAQMNIIKPSLQYPIR
ncbi:uncharacterized protein LOC107039435 [Diachasma alloeum]|uniref:uncharacterized protein LOC107039435 n=1 Tax=Diachasma alloeum TaxID=454923 RepID=UPI0007381119|nr:uncharacterized protein LOC107039435 [Diachasma alloeum]